MMSCLFFLLVTIASGQSHTISGENWSGKGYSDEFSCEFTMPS
jgi:hypothetical protein